MEVGVGGVGKVGGRGREREDRNIKEDYEKLYVNKLENLEEIIKSLETYILPKLNQEGIKKNCTDW